MTYGDENIISTRLEAQAKKAHTISNKVTIGGCLYCFERSEFPPHFSMILPKSFGLLKPEYARVKYPYENRPKTILSNEATDTDFAFQFGDMPAVSLNERIVQYKAQIKRLNPSYVFLQERIYKMPGNLEVACYDFRSPALDKDIYNLSFFTDLLDTGLFGWITCPIELQEKWEPLLREMIQSIEVLSREE